MPPVVLEVQEDSEIEESSAHSEEYDTDSDDDTDDQQNDFEERQKKSGRAEVKDIASPDTRKVRRWKIILVFVLLAATTILSAGTYYFLTLEETDNAQDSYELLVSAMRETVQERAKNLEQSLKSLSQLVAASASIAEQWHIVGPSTLALSDVTVIAYSPLVNTREDIPTYFESTVADQQDWYNRSVHAWVKQNEYGAQLSDYDLSEESFRSEIYNLNADIPYPADGTGPFAPLWLMTPPPLSPENSIHYNLLDINLGQFDQRSGSNGETGFFSRFLEDGEAPDFLGMVMTPETETAYRNKSLVEDSIDSPAIANYPDSLYWKPVWSDPYDQSGSPIGFLTSYIAWEAYVAQLLPDQNTQGGIVLVIHNSCGQAATYELMGDRKARYLGPGDLHDNSYDSTERVVHFSPATTTTASSSSTNTACQYSFHFYASDSYEDEFHTNQPICITAIVGGMFAVLVLTFGIYVFFVERRNRKLMSKAAKTNEIVASLFPEAVRKRLFNDKENDDAKAATKGDKASADKDTLNEKMIEKYLAGNGMDDELNEQENFMYKSRPIADLYPETTIMFADLVGFTAWSSTRDPAQVFTLLETFYKAFDGIASRRGVFKVETIGDCYVAVAGLPEPRNDHAVVMCRFASECMERMNFLSQKLEVHLGPDTAELEMRAGLHSGPVTAGVLRGVRSRFQLFGDTMNTASRMESTGHHGKIQVSEETAELLVEAGKESWITPREEKIVAKGKGELQTYWVEIASAIDLRALHDGYSSIGGSLTYDNGAFAALSPKTTRLVLWNVEILLDLLRQIHVLRGKPTHSYHETVVLSKNSRISACDEFVDAVEFPPFNKESLEIDTVGVQLKEEIEHELEDYLSTIASMYIENHFHDFAHASHATMGVVKLLSSLVKSKPQQGETPEQSASLLIASSPLVQFAIVLSIICHDNDHPGVPNSILIKEKSRMASVYGYKSVAEQNSFDLAFDLLMDDSYANLRSAIYQSEKEKKLFRQVLVNCTISTDLFDVDLKKRFDSRWQRAFPEPRGSLRQSHRQSVRQKTSAATLNLQATLIMETMVQASDIAHTMQHWQVYRKWNVRLFEEVYQSFVDKRKDADPSEDWYENEINFFDRFVLPIVRRLQESGAFVAASTDSNMDYAEQNLSQWVDKGRDIVAEMANAAKGKIVATSTSQELPLGLEASP